MTKRAKDGIWTPWAALVCSDCHGRVETGEPGSWSHRIVDTRDRDLREGEDDETLARCDRCGCEIWVDRYNVGPCATARTILRDAEVEAELDQTGGMCCACSVRHPDGYYVYVTDGEEPEDAGEWFCVGAYGPADSQADGVSLACFGDEPYVLCRREHLVERVKAALAELPEKVDWADAFNENRLAKPIGWTVRDEEAWTLARCEESVTYALRAFAADHAADLDLDRVQEVRDYLVDLDYKPTPHNERETALVEKAVPFVEWAETVCES